MMKLVSGIVTNHGFLRISSFLITSFTHDLNQFLMYDNPGIQDTLLIYI
jgi:hypothetical protein